MNIINDIEKISYVIKTLFILIYTNYIFLKLLNIENMSNKCITLIFFMFISIISTIIKEKFDVYACYITRLLSMVILNVKYNNKIGFTIISISISWGIAYLLWGVSAILTSIPTMIFKINNDYIILSILILMYSSVVYCMFKIKKIKKGLIFLQNKIDNENLELLLLNISSMILFVPLIIVGAEPVTYILVIVIVSIITIRYLLVFYYKHNLLVQDLKDTKEKLEEKTREVEELEKEILNFSKTSHSLAHKQKALEYRINELIYKNEIESELGLKDDLENLSKEVYEKQVETELSKTEIPEIDNMLKFMQAEAISKNIEFELQINGNIHYMINHFVGADELSILIADHVKDAIIAIEYSDNINKNILVKLGNIDDSYGLYIYDSGIEFEKETLDNLGKKPITTHADNGGTGLGFMNTFDTLRKHNASLIIQELGKPSKDDFTKIIMIKFDNKNEFNVKSYKNKVTAN